MQSDKKTEAGRQPAPKIKTEDVRRARTILEKYRQGKQNLENRIIENEKWFRLRHWDTFPTKDGSRRRPASGGLFHALADKHADAMGNYPGPCGLRRAVALQPGGEQARRRDGQLP